MKDGPIFICILYSYYVGFFLPPNQIAHFTRHRAQQCFRTCQQVARTVYNMAQKCFLLLLMSIGICTSISFSSCIFCLSFCTFVSFPVFILQYFPLICLFLCSAIENEFLNEKNLSLCPYSRIHSPAVPQQNL